MKKLSLFLAAILVASSMTGCGGGSDTTSNSTSSESSQSTTQVAETKTVDQLLHEKYEEPVTIKVALGYRDSENPDTPKDVTPETQTAIKLFKDKFNINLEYTWIVNGDQYDAKFGAELAAGNLPDMMQLSPNQFQDLYEQGGLADLTDVYNKYTNDNIKAVVNFDDNVIKSGMKDNKIYGLPNSTYAAQATSQTYYRMDWLKKAGYNEAPKTVKQFEELCDKLMTLDLDGNGKTGDPVIPTGKGYYGQGLADMSPLFGAYETSNGGWVVNESGKVAFEGVNPKLKEPLSKLNEWYKKGYMAKDFAAQDIWAANSKIASDIVAGKFGIVFGSWWIGNWPLNDNLNNQPEAEWAVGPTLSLDGNLPKILIPKYPVANFTVVSSKCKNPEALFKMMNYSIEWTVEKDQPDTQAKMTEAEKKEYNSYVYHWLPYRVYCPASLVDNYKAINEVGSKGLTEMPKEYIQKNTEFWPAWNSYLKIKDSPKDGAIWGRWFSRLSPDGGVAKMIELYEGAEKRYDELYVTTPTMVTKIGDLDKLRDTTFLSIIMGAKPISEFDQYVTSWGKMGGDKITQEVNEWYSKNK